MKLQTCNEIVDVIGLVFGVATTELRTMERQGMEQRTVMTVKGQG